jgi:hypothetical protein
MTKLQKLERIKAILNYVNDESPVDFLGTGSDSRWADKCEQEWRNTIQEGMDLADGLIASLKKEAARKKKDRQNRVTDADIDRAMRE